MKIRHLFVLLLTAAGYPCIINAQISPEIILDSINNGRKPERIFTHFDKYIYRPGETIWYKSYITSANFPTLYSTVARAELISEDGRIVRSQLLPVTLGSATGGFELPDTLSHGVYVFRLFTQHMHSMAKGETYSKHLLILPETNYFNPDIRVSDIKLQFYPEGGTFLGDEPNILAFRSTDQLGRPASVKGVIKDRDGNRVIEFSSSHNGMGKVEFKPAVSQTYTAHYELPSGEVRSLPLPAVRKTGTNITVSNELMQKQLYIDSRFGSDEEKPAYILGEMDALPVFKIDMAQLNGHYQGVIQVKDLEGGLLHIGVFSGSHRLLAERTCYVNSIQDTVAGTINVISSNLSPRAANKVSFSLNDSIEGYFSVAVTDLIQTDLATHPVTGLGETLITGNLQLPPGAALYNLGAMTGMGGNDAIDLLLLTHPYKWNWSQLEKIAGTPYRELSELFITLTGKATLARSKQILANAELSFIIQTSDSALNHFSATTDDAGIFNIRGLRFGDSATLFVKNNANRERYKKVNIEIISKSLSTAYAMPVPPSTIRDVIPAFAVDKENLKKATARPPAFEMDSATIVLQELVVQSKALTPTQQVENRYSTGMFGGSARSTIDFINNPLTYSGGNVFDYLKGRYGYMQVMGNPPNYLLNYRGMKSLGSGAPVPMSLFLDEMQVDASMLMSVPMREIAMIRIYTTSVLTGNGGALVVYRKKGEDQLNNNDYTVMEKIRVEGFSKVPEFNSPNYAEMKKTTIKHDNRTTLFWNPFMIVLPEDGPVPITFYNNDSGKKIKIVIQGMTSNGKFVYAEKIIQ